MIKTLLKFPLEVNTRKKRERKQISCDHEVIWNQLLIVRLLAVINPHCSPAMILCKKSFVFFKLKGNYCCLFMYLPSASLICLRQEHCERSVIDDLTRQVELNLGKLSLSTGKHHSSLHARELRKKITKR